MHQTRKMRQCLRCTQESLPHDFQIVSASETDTQKKRNERSKEKTVQLAWFFYAVVKSDNRIIVSISNRIDEMPKYQRDLEHPISQKFNASRQSSFVYYRL